MEKSPLVFKSAAEICIARTAEGAVSLTAPGFACEVSVQYSGITFMLRTIQDTCARECDEPPVFMVCAGANHTQTICHFTSRSEADALITAIGEVRRSERRKSGVAAKGLRMLSTFGEICTVAIVAGFLGAASAKIGWDFVTQFGVGTSNEQALAAEEFSIQQNEKVRQAAAAWRSMRAAESLRSLSEYQSSKDEVAMRVLEGHMAKSLQATQGSIETESE